MTLLWAVVAQALAAPATVGLFVGSNRPGEGQEPLRYAMRDVIRMQSVLEELGSLDVSRSVTLVDPDADEVLGAMEALRRQVLLRAERGEQTVFVFYYSGHAKREALSLGATEVSLRVLRDQLESMPSTVTLAFLDACQSGAISRVKGIRSAESFSYRSADVLPAEGLALMASSTATELSQESDTLQGSFFTHHLVTGLRGPADVDGDGTVTFGEAYQYAQRSTLVSTAATRTGSQHVTVETQLRGRGDVVLTRPQSADAWLELDVPWTGRVLVLRADNDAVVAEVVKQRGSFRIAVPAGAYRVLATNETGPVACSIDVRTGQSARLSNARCGAANDPGRTTIKSVSEPAEPTRLQQRRRAWSMETVAVEYGLGLGVASVRGGYYDMLDTFGFESRLSALFTHGVAISVRLSDHAGLVVSGSNLLDQGFTRFVRDADGEIVSDEFTIEPLRLGAYARLATPLGVPAIVGYVQSGPGLSLATTEFQAALGDSRRQRFLAPHLEGAAGLQFMVRTRTVKAGIFVQAEGLWSPIARNELGQLAEVGGLFVQTGLRVGW